VDADAEDGGERHGRLDCGRGRCRVGLLIFFWSQRKGMKEGHISSFFC
jgi:hypothetical protein